MYYTEYTTRTSNNTECTTRTSNNTAQLFDLKPQKFEGKSGLKLLMYYTSSYTHHTRTTLTIHHTRQ